MRLYRPLTFFFCDINSFESVYLLHYDKDTLKKAFKVVFLT